MHLHCYGFSFFYIYLVVAFFLLLSFVIWFSCYRTGNDRCQWWISMCTSSVWLHKLRTTYDASKRKRVHKCAAHNIRDRHEGKSRKSSRNWYLHSQSCFLSSCRLNGEYDLALVDAILVGVCECLRAPECTWIYCTFSNHHQQRRLKIVVAYRMLYVDILIGCVYGFSFEYHGINHAYAVYNLIIVCVPIYTGNHSHSALSVAIKLK